MWHQNQSIQWHLQKVILQDGVTAIKNNAFDSCLELNSVTLPDSLQAIGHIAFASCAQLTSITLPAGLTDFGYYIFIDCDNLTCRVTEGSEAQKYCEHDKISYTICQPEP